MAEGQADFGYRRVERGEKARLVRGVFDSVARRYDLMNDLMSGGLHRLWKDAFVDWLAPRAPLRLIDLAGGTGDIAFRVLRRCPAAEVTVADINAEMLATGRRRAAARALEGRLAWLCADAEGLPLPDRSADAVTVAFGIRNCTDIGRVLAEAFRVLRVGGRFLCLEFSRPSVVGLDPLYDAYSFRVVPRLGALVARDREAYRYLVESIRRFPDQERFSGMMAEAGFAAIRHRDMAGGVVSMHSGWRA